MVLLDEPYGELDPPGFRLVDRVLGAPAPRGARSSWPPTSSSAAATLCDQALVLEEGALAWAGRAADLPAEAAGAGEGSRA